MLFAGSYEIGTAMREFWKFGRVAQTKATFGGIGFCGVLVVATFGAEPAEPSFDTTIKPVLAQRCVLCHGTSSPQAGLNLARFTDGTALRADIRLLRKIAARVKANEMPPAGSAPLAAAEKQALLGWIEQAEAAPVGAQTDPGPPLLRRLTRVEYDNTIRDLIGIDFNSREAVGLPDDAVGDGFDNLAVALNVPPTLMEKYVSAADNILDRIVAGPDGRVPDKGDSDLAQRAHDALFGKKSYAQSAPREAARRILAAFAQRAYRRPVADRDIGPLLGLYDRATAHGKRFEEALRYPLKAILVSPYFLFRAEFNRSGVAPDAAYPVDDYALASRLSYFLWASMPDEPLFALAAQKKLSDPSVLTEQTRRMLADPKARALTDDFGVQWLQLRKLAHARPSTDSFPSFDADLRAAMYNETTTFFDKLRTEDKSVLDLLDADYTYVNETLAKHYGLSGVTGDKLRLVKLNPEDHRGGLLGMGSILAMTSASARTSPTLRGKWVLEAIFGTPPPPPPPGVSQIADEQSKQKSGLTFRDLLAQHAHQPACAACHHKIDPLGFALENYDAIGRWRTTQGDKPLDASGQLPTGEKLNGAADLKRVILQRKDAFVRNLSEKMLTYALGRELTSADEPTVQQIVGGLKKNDYRFSTLIADITQSVPFRYRRNSAPAKPGTESTRL